MLRPRRRGRPPGLAGPGAPAYLNGAALMLAERPLLRRWRERYGNVFAIPTPVYRPLVIVADPAEAKRVFTADPASAHAGEANRLLEPIMGPRSVLVLDEGAHLHQRKLLLPPLHGRRMLVYGDLMREVTEDEIDGWPLGGAFPLHPSMQRITLRVILRAIFGIEDGDRLRLFEQLIVDQLNASRWGIVAPPVRRIRWPTFLWQRFLRLRERLDAELYAEIRARRAAPDVAERADVLSMLVQARDEDGHPMTDQEVRDELMTLQVAGHETTASALAWTWERLLRHPPALARLRRELEAGDEGYLDCVIKESTRVRPPLSYAVRRLKAPMEVAGHTVPAGATIGVCFDLVHHRADLYPEPHEFRPERFEADHPAETYTWLPFGGGVRRCIGAAFANFEMRVVIKTVLERCDLQPASPRPEAFRRRSVGFVPARGARAVLVARTPREPRPRAAREGVPAGAPV